MMIDDDRDRRLIRRIGALRRRWLWILKGASACAAAALLVSLLLPNVFRATTDILISESKIGAGSREQVWQQTVFLPTFKAFVDNDELIGQSLKKLGLDRPPYNLTVDRFRRKDYLDVQIPKSTRLLEVTVEFPDAKLAAALANDLARRAVAFNARMNQADTLVTQEFLKNQLDEASDRLQRMAAGRLKVRQEARLEEREKQLSILLNQKEFLAGQLDQLRLSLVQQDSKSRTLAKALKDQPQKFVLKKSVAGDPILGRVAERAKDGDLTLSMNEESLNTTRQEIGKELVNAEASGAAERTGIRTAAQRLAAVNQEISQLLPKLSQLQSRVEEADRNYSLALEAVKSATRQYRDASVMVSAKSQDLKQLAPALVPERPVRPRIVLNTLLGFFLGAALLAVVAVGIENYKELRALQPAGLEERERIPVETE